MFVLVSYDVSTINPAGRRRLRHVSKACLDFGQRVQNSVFECIVDPGQWAVLRGRLLYEMKDDEDSLRFYFLGSNYRNKVEHHGIKDVPDLEGTLLF